MTASVSWDNCLQSTFAGGCVQKASFWQRIYSKSFQKKPVPDYADEEVADLQLFRNPCFQAEEAEVKSMYYCCCGGSQKDKHDREKLKRVLGCPELTLLSVSMTLGTAGVFAMPGMAVHVAGPGAAPIFSSLISGSVMLLIGLCLAELAAAVPSPGAASSYIYCYYGEALAYFVGWNIVLENIAACGAEARVWTHYAHALLRMGNITSPEYVYRIDFPDDGSLSSVNVSAAALIILMAVIAIGGLKQSSLVNTIAMFFKFGVLLFFLIYCFLKFHPEYLTPVFPHHAKGVFKGAARIFYCYLGFDVCSMAAETRNPRKALPAAIISSIVIVTLIYTGIAIALCGGATYHHISKHTPLLSVVTNRVGRAFLSTAALLFGPIVILGTIVTSKIRCNQPINATLFTTLLCVIAGLFFDVATLGDLCSIPAAVFINSSIILLRFLTGLLSISLYTEHLMGVLFFGGIISVIIAIVSTWSFIVQSKQTPVHVPAKKKLFMMPFVPLTPLIGIVALELIILGVTPRSLGFYVLYVIVLIPAYFVYTICLPPYDTNAHDPEKEHLISSKEP